MNVRRMQIRASADTSAIRSATYNDRAHLVVPVIALLGDIVITPLGSDGPEFVPSSVLSKIPAAWNGRPVLTDHPAMSGDGGGSANVPSVLEQMKVGEIFDTEWDGKKLRMNAYLDIDRSTSMGGDAESLLSRCQSGETIEVSVGCYVELEKIDGTAPDGTDYAYKWLDLAQDHLAMLPAGVKGACSVSAGCGAPRLNAAKEINTMAKTEKVEGAQPPRSLLSRFMTALGVKAAGGSAEGESVNDLRGALQIALYNEEPGFQYVQDVFLETATVVYEVYRDGKYAYFQRTYEKDGDEYKLNSDTEEVVMSMQYKPAADTDAGNVNSEKVVALRAAECSCGGHVAQNEQKEEAMSKIKELATRLIASKRFAEEDRAVLETLPEARLEALADEQIATETPAPVVPEPEPKPVEPAKPKTEAEYLAEAPASIREMVSRHQAQEKQIRATIIKSLGDAQKVFTVEQLNAKSTDELRQLAQLASAAVPEVDFAGLAADNPSAPTSAAPPRGYSLALAARKAATAQKAN